MYYLAYCVCLALLFVFACPYVIDFFTWRGLLKNKEQESLLEGLIIMLLCILALVPVLLKMPWALT